MGVSVDGGEEYDGNFTTIKDFLKKVPKEAVVVVDYQISAGPSYAAATGTALIPKSKSH